jgi:hypothetical protein
MQKFLNLLLTTRVFIILPKSPEAMHNEQHHFSTVLSRFKKNVCDAIKHRDQNAVHLQNNYFP